MLGCTQYVHHVLLCEKDRVEKESKKTNIKARCDSCPCDVIPGEAEAGDSLCLLAGQIRELESMRDTVPKKGNSI